LKSYAILVDDQMRSLEGIMARLAIENGIVVTMGPDPAPIVGGHVLIEGDRIVAVGPGPAPVGEDTELIDARGGLVLPGLIDTHAHAGHGLTKGLGGTSGDWMTTAGRIYAQATDTDFWRAEARLSALERLSGGVTTACLLMGGGPDVMMTAEAAPIFAHAEGVASIGVAEVLAIGPGRPNGPGRYVDWSGGAARDIATSPGAQLAVTAAALAGPWPGLVRPALSLPVFSAADLADDDAEGAAAISRSVLAPAADTGPLLVQDGHREGTLAAAEARVGLGGPHAVFAHCIDLTEADIAALTRSGAAVAHNPSALMSVTGRCPAPELIAAGVTVSIGSDAPAPDRSFDVFRNLFQAHRLHARHFRADTVLSCERLLRMATIDAARALGLDAEIGSLEPGKRADVVIVDWRTPHLWPPAEPLQRLTRFATAADVATVVVGGRVRMRDRRFPDLDPDGILDEALSAYATMLARAGLADRFAPLVPVSGAPTP